MATDKANKQIGDWLIEQVDTVINSGDVLLQYLYHPFATRIAYYKQGGEFAELDGYNDLVHKKTRAIERTIRDAGLWGPENKSNLAIRELLHHITELIPKTRHAKYDERILNYVVLRIKQLQS